MDRIITMTLAHANAILRGREDDREPMWLRAMPSAFARACRAIVLYDWTWYAARVDARYRRRA